jgi:hypothetical protein
MAIQIDTLILRVKQMRFGLSAARSRDFSRPARRKLVFRRAFGYWGDRFAL